MQPNNPMQVPMPAQTDVSQGPTDGGEGPTDEICIARYPDGTYSVYLEDGQAPLAEEAGAPSAPSPGGQPLMEGMLAEGAESEGGRGERLESLELALKAAVKLDREHPLGATDNEQFKSAFKSQAQSAGY